jgi:nucleoid DNA-binding protein
MAKTEAKKKAASKPLSKSGIIEALTEALGESISRKQVKAVVEELATVGHKELKKNGVFVLPGFAKFVVVKKPARPAREGINPFTKEKQKFAAKPASKGVRARPVKAIKDALGLERIRFGRGSSTFRGASARYRCSTGARDPIVARAPEESSRQPIRIRHFSRRCRPAS